MRRGDRLSSPSTACSSPSRGATSSRSRDSAVHSTPQSSRSSSLQRMPSPSSQTRSKLRGSTQSTCDDRQEGSGARCAALDAAKSLADVLDKDPLLALSFGSVSDNIRVDAVEWSDHIPRGSEAQSGEKHDVPSPPPRNKEAAKFVHDREREKERRTGFAAAYQQRIAALSQMVWTTLTPRGDRGVMRPLEADADLSAYVSGLGSPVDPDVELSSVAHLQAFRWDASPEVRRDTRKADRNNDNAQAKGSVATHGDRSISNAESHPDTNEGPPRQGGTPQRPRLPSRRCSRPAVQAPVPGDYSAYNSSASDDNYDGETSSDEAALDPTPPPTASEIGRSSRRGRTRRDRSVSPSSRRQCAIGLKTSGAPTLPRSKKTSNDRPSVRRGNLGNSDASQTTPKCRQSTRGRIVGDSRGRAESVKHVQLSTSPGRDAGISTASESTLADLLASLQLRLPSSTPLDKAGIDDGTILASSSSSTSMLLDSARTYTDATVAAWRLPLVGANGITHLAGRPSMVSNGAHLLMLSLELEMMRKSKISGSLKPRWVKARMRLEPPTDAAAGVKENEEGGIDVKGMSEVSAPISPKVCVEGQNRAMGGAMRRSALSRRSVRSFRHQCSRLRNEVLPGSTS